MQAAETRARIEGDEGKSVALDQVDDDVGLPARVVLLCVFYRSRLIEHHSPLRSSTVLAGASATLADHPRMHALMASALNTSSPAGAGDDNLADDSFRPIYLTASNSAA